MASASLVQAIRGLAPSGSWARAVSATPGLPGTGARKLVGGAGKVGENAAVLLAQLDGGPTRSQHRPRLGRTYFEE